MPRKPSTGLPPAPPACAAVTGATGPTGGWTYTNLTTGTLTNPFSDATGIAAYREPHRRAIDAVAWRGGFALGTGAVTVAVGAGAELADGARLSFRSATATTGPLNVNHGLPAQWWPTEFNPDTGPTAVAFPSLVLSPRNDGQTLDFFLPELTLEAPGMMPERLEHPAATELRAGVFAAIPAPCGPSPTGPPPTGPVPGPNGPTLLVGHLAVAESLPALARHSSGDPLFGACGLNADLWIAAVPVALTVSGGTGPVSIGTTGPAYAPTAPAFAELRLFRRTATSTNFLSRAPRLTTRAAPRINALDLDRATGTVRLRFLTGPTAPTGATPPPESWTAAFTITGVTANGPDELRDRLFVPLAPPGGTLTAGAYALELSEDFQIPYNPTPLGRPRQRPTPTGALPTAARLLYPVEFGFVVDPTGPAAVLTSPPSASVAPVQSLEIAANETSPTLQTATEAFLPYRLTKNGQTVPGGVRFRGRNAAGPITHALEIRDATGPGTYALEPTASGAFRDQAGLANIAPWNRVTWRTVATGIPAGELEQFPAPLTTAPASVALRFSENVTGVATPALTTYVDGQAYAHQAHVTGSGSSYTISNLADVYAAGYAVWLEFATDAVQTSANRTQPAGPIRSAWVKANEPASLADANPYLAPTDTVGSDHFAVTATAPADALPTGPAHAGLRIANRGSAFALDVFTLTPSGDPIAAIDCPTTGTTGRVLQALQRDAAFTQVAIDCPRPPTAFPLITGVSTTPAPKAPRADGRHAIYTGAPTDIRTLQLTIAADRYTSAPGYLPNDELFEVTVPAEVWGAYLTNGTYTLSGEPRNGRKRPPGLYVLEPHPLGATMRIEPAPRDDRAYLHHFPVDPQTPAPYDGPAFGIGPLTAEIVQAFLDAGGGGPRVVPESRLENWGHFVTWEIAATQTQAWCTVAREFPGAGSRCREPVAFVGGLRVSLAMRTTYALEANGPPADRSLELTYVRQHSNHHEILVRRVYSRATGPAVIRTSSRARVYGASLLLSPAEAAAWIGGEPLVRRFAVNQLRVFDGVAGGSDPIPVNFQVPPGDMEPGHEGEGDLVPVPPATFCTLTLTANRT